MSLVYTVGYNLHLMEMVRTSQEASLPLNFIVQVLVFRATSFPLFNSTQANAWRFISVCFFSFVCSCFWANTSPCFPQCLCRGQRTTRCLFLPPLSLRQGLLFIPVYARVGTGLLGILLSLTPLSIGVLGLHMWSTLQSLWVPHACPAGSLPTEPAPVPLKQLVCFIPAMKSSPYSFTYFQDGDTINSANWDGSVQ